ncbi:MAG TPA: hypothetical protein VK459_16655 [Polyangiaceae bacterium]|jgi:hypothetical protein|nr:hypothetical protein [Polyangiaceae bacterium]
MITVAHKVGRLVEVRIITPVTAEEIQGMGQRIGFAYTACAPRPIVGCTDLRGANLFPMDLAEQVATVMKTGNPRIERGAILVGESALFSLQVERVVREAGNPSRRAFRVRAELEAWLAEVLTPFERQRVKHFLKEGEQALAELNRRPG